MRPQSTSSPLVSSQPSTTQSSSWHTVQGSGSQHHSARRWMQCSACASAHRWPSAGESHRRRAHEEQTRGSGQDRALPLLPEPRRVHVRHSRAHEPWRDHEGTGLCASVCRLSWAAHPFHLAVEEILHTVQCNERQPCMRSSQCSPPIHWIQPRRWRSHGSAARLRTRYALR